MTNDRRVTRSDVRHRALDLLLAGAREKKNAVAIALTTHEGLYVAGSGAEPEALEQLGALGAARHTHWKEARLHVRELLVGSEALALTTVGGTLESPELDEGIRRILG